MNKWFVLVLSAMFAMAPVAVVAEDVPSATVEVSEAEIDAVLEEIGATAEEEVKEEVKEEATTESEEAVETVGAEEDSLSKYQSKFSTSGDRYGIGTNFSIVQKELNSSAFYAGETIYDGSLVAGIGLYAGNKLTLVGGYEYGVHVANELYIGGLYTRDLFAAGSTINIDKTAILKRDVYLAGGTVHINADIAGTAFIAADKIVITDAKIAGDLRVAAGELEFAGNVEIAGKLVKNDTLTIINLEAAKITEVEEYETPKLDFIIKNKIVWVLLHLASMIVTAVVFSIFAKGFFNKIREESKNASAVEMMSYLGLGAGLMIGMPVIAALLMLIIVGIPAGLLMLAAWLLFCFLGTSVSAYYIGSKVMPAMNPIISTILVLILIVILNMVPYLNWLFVILEVCFGVGIIGRGLLSKKTAPAE